MDAAGSPDIAKLRHYFLVASLHAGRQYTLHVEEELNPFERTVTVRWSRAILLHILQIASHVYKKERSESRAYDRQNRQLSRGRRNGKTHMADCGSDHFGKFCTDDEFPKVCRYCNTKKERIGSFFTWHRVFLRHTYVVTGGDRVGLICAEVCLRYESGDLKSKTNLGSPWGRISSCNDPALP